MDFSKLKVSTRLAWSFGSLIALMAIIIGAAMFGLMSVDRSVETLVDNRIPKLERLNDLAFRSMDNARIVRNIVLLTDDNAIASNKAQFDKNSEANNQSLDYLRANLVIPADQEKLKQLMDARATYRAYTARVLELSYAHQNEEAIKTLFGEGYKTQSAYFAAIQALVDVQKARLAGVSKDSKSAYDTARNTMAVVGLIAVGVAVLLAWLITRSLLGQLGGEPSAAAEIAQRVAAGDLSRPVPLKQGDSQSLMAHISAMQDSLVRVVSGVRGNAESVATASAQIAQGNQDLSSRTEEQASALQQTAASMEELGSTVKQNAENARQANQLAQGACEVAVRGGTVVGEVVQTMHGINDASKRIADIIGVIDGIAFQTNILALNAAVEAARAGEQGRGFAVVAGEVRTLAQRSAEAAKEIKSLINASVERVELGTSQVERAGATMTEVVTAIRRVTDIVSEISSASLEQSSGVGQVGEAVSQMDRATQQNAALVEESAAAAESLKAQAEQLVQAMAVFRTR